jgi:YcaO-like protein with predicted kinase domain
LLWVEGRDLRDGTPRWLPFESVHTDFTLPLPEGSGAFFMSSNGLASGNHPLEALSHGLCEVVERDATCLWHLRGEAARRETRLDPDTVDDPACLQVLERFERAGMEVAVWETTTDVELASFYCVLAERSPEPLRPRAPTSGAGCHPAREVALLRALTEAAQVRLTFISGARDDLGLSRCYTAFRDPVVWRQEVERMRGGPPARRFQDVPTFVGRTFDEDVAWELARLAEAGLHEAVAVDLSRPELGIPVTRVVVAGYVPGRRARDVLKEHAS